MNKLTEKQKEVLREMVNCTCQVCEKTQLQTGKLQPHRIKRGNAGGLYVPNNILMVCEKCHKRLHSREFR